MEDAKSKLLVVGPQGNEAAEAAKRAPCISLQVASNGINAAPTLDLKSRTDGFEIETADLGAGLPEPVNPGRWWCYMLFGFVVYMEVEYVCITRAVAMSLALSDNSAVSIDYVHVLM